MTAFAHKDLLATKAEFSAEISWEIRSVNHRYLDVSLSLPSHLMVFENNLNNQIRSRLGRGKIDAKVVLNI